QHREQRLLLVRGLRRRDQHLRRAAHHGYELRPDERAELPLRLLRRDDADLHAAGQHGRLFLTPTASKSSVAAILGTLDRVKTRLAHVPTRAGAAVALAALSTVVGCGSDALPFFELQSSVLTATCRYDVLCQNY